MFNTEVSTMTKILSIAAMFLVASIIAGCDGGGTPESTAESTTTTEQTDTTTTGTTETTEDAAKPASE